MSENPSISAKPRSLGVRALLMLAMFVAFHIAAWALFFTAIVQLALAAFAGGADARIQDFGRGLGRYLAQVAGFVTFASEDAPFPFSDWPQS